MTVFEAYITNLGKYAEGQLVGETLKFPATTEEVQSLLKNIGVDGVRYEEFFITAFDGNVMGLYDYLTEYENLDELNHLAHLISELDSDEIETLEAALNKGDHILPSRKQTTSLMMNFPHGLKMKRKIFKSWSMLENGQKQKRQKHLSITMKSLNLF